MELATRIERGHCAIAGQTYIAEPHPNVLNRTSLMTCVAGSTLIWSRMTSPHAGAPTNPSPTELSDLSNVPTFRGRE